MANAPTSKRTDSGSRFIRASPHIIYEAMLNQDAVAAWRPPAGMKAEVYAFEPREGGIYRMAFIYQDKAYATAEEDHQQGIRSTLENLAAFAVKREM